MPVIKKQDNQAGPPASQARALRAGQTIIEATIALAAILLTLTAIAVAISTSVNNSQFIKLQTQASKLAQDGMEQMRYLRNTEPSNFFNRNGIYCMGQDGLNSSGGACNPQSNPDDIISGQFKRDVEFIQTTSIDCGDSTKVIVNVYWASGKCDPATEISRFCHKSQLVSCFTNQTGSSSSL